MTSAFSWQNSISLCPASFRIPRPNLPVKYTYIYNFHRYIHIYIYTHTYAFFRKLNYFEKTVRKLKCQVNEPPRDNNHILSLKERSMIKHYCSSFYFTYVGYWICLVGYTDTHKFFNSKSFRG